MKSFIVKRSWPDFDRMIEITKWCEEVFGKMDYLRWNLNFARGTEDYVEFEFKRDEDASAFVFQWDQYCISKDEQYKRGLLRWDEL